MKFLPKFGFVIRRRVGSTRAGFARWWWVPPAGVHARDAGHALEDRGVPSCGGETAGETHVGVELPHEAAEVWVVEVLGQDLGAELVELVHRELLAVSHPRHDVVSLLVGHDRVAAGWEG